MKSLLLFRWNPSAIFALTETALRLIWFFNSKSGANFFL
jgi:hypothetical protein